MLEGCWLVELCGVLQSQCLQHVLSSGLYLNDSASTNPTCSFGQRHHLQPDNALVSHTSGCFIPCLRTSLNMSVLLPWHMSMACSRLHTAHTLVLQTRSQNCCKDMHSLWMLQQMQVGVLQGRNQLLTAQIISCCRDFLLGQPGVSIAGANDAMFWRCAGATVTVKHVEGNMRKCMGVNAHVIICQCLRTSVVSTSAVARGLCWYTEAYVGGCSLSLSAPRLSATAVGS